MGGYLTFASLEKGEESASGQIPVREMKKILDMISS
jgi:3-dehydroquinate dehydratase